MTERHHKPVKFAPRVFESFAAGADPAELSAAATRAAEALLNHGRHAEDDEIVARLVRLTDAHGLGLLSELWSHSHPRTLAGSLFRLYTLRAAINRKPGLLARHFAAGAPIAQLPHAVAGVAEPATGEEVAHMADAILTGAFDGEYDVALERCAAFCRVVALGQAAEAERVDAGAPDAASRLTHASLRLVRTAEDLEAAARMWRAGDLR